MNFRDLMKREDDNDGDDKPQNFYAGSGQNIQDGASSSNDLVSSILNKAKLNARKQQDEERKASGSTFTGKPRTLDGNAEVEDNNFVESEEKMKVTKVLLVFWSNGFSVSPEGRPSRFFPMDDPRSQRILRNIQMGLAPLKEFGMESGMDVSMQIDDSHRSIPFDEAELKRITSHLLPQSPEPKPNVFNSGQGQKLASSSSTTTTTHNSEWPTFPIDSSQPTTRLQIRFGNNQRYPVSFNN